MNQSSRDVARPLPQDYLLAIIGSKGKPVIDSTGWKAGLAGALVVEAVLGETLRLTDKGEVGVKAGRLVLTRRAVGDDPWSEALRRAEGHTPKDAVARIGGARTYKDRAGRLFHVLAADLVQQEVLEPEQGTMLGVFPTTRWRLVDPGVRESLLRRVDVALAGDGFGDARDAALASILHASGALPKLFADADRRLLKRRGRALMEGSWGPEAVAKAIADVNTAVMAGAVTAAVGGAVAGG